MTELTKTDLHFVVSRLPKDVRDIMAKHKLCMGGGFIRAIIAGEKPSDIDLFGPSEAVLKLAAYELATHRRSTYVHTTKNAITVASQGRLTVQMITRWLFDEPAKIIESFDFTIAKSVVWVTVEKSSVPTAILNIVDTFTWRSLVDDAFYPDLAARRLVYTSPQRNEDAGGSILRMRKFIQRGYSIQPNSLGAVIARLVTGVEMGKIKDEAHLAMVLSGLLREVDPLIMVDGIPVDEHELT
jgi:hypothetical protein